MSAVVSKLNSNIRAEMARRGVTQSQLAADAGFSQPALSRRLTGEAEWSVAEIYQLADALQVPLSALLPEAAA